MVRDLSVFRHYYLLFVFRNYTFLTDLLFFSSLIGLISKSERREGGVLMFHYII